jgi:OFA family oxalate/formate antiporter-like MFS transporter
VAQQLIQTVGVLKTFAYLGVAYFIVILAAGFFMQNPPAGWTPEGWTPTATQTAQRAKADYTLGSALARWQWWAMWLLLFLNTSAGISLISQEAPIFQKLTSASAAVAAGMVGIVSIGNSVGRIFWASVSDAITRRWTFAVMYVFQFGLFWLLPSLTSVAVITVISFVILMCYGGGFGTMPAFAADYFGSKNIGPIYGLMLTAWGFASYFGPQLIVKLLGPAGSYARGLHTIAFIMLISTALPIIVSPPKQKTA